MNIRNYNLGNYIVPDEVKNGICLEIGANVGSFTEKYQNYFSKIHYYEPLKECFSLIQSKINLPHIVGFNLAGYKTTGDMLEMVLHHNEDSGSTGLKTDSLNSEWGDNIIQYVKTISLKDMISNLGVDTIDYCKSDCETSEYYIFMDEDISNIKYLALEMHHQMGEEKWNRLLKHILKTHDLISGNSTHQPGSNKDLFFKRK